MRRYRFFIAESQLQDGEATILGADARQIRTVLRLGVGDELEVIAAGRCYAARITKVTKDSVTAEVTETLRACAEPAVKITLAQALPKGNKLDWIVQKGTELGVSEFVFFRSSRCVARLDAERADSRVSRLIRIAKEAAEQSGGCVVPEVRAVVTLRELLARVGEYDSALICWEGQGARMLGDVALKLPEVGNVLLVVGPEGGFTEEEIAEAVGAGAELVSLGSRVLRCETAALVASAIIVHEMDRRAGRRTRMKWR